MIDGSDAIIINTEDARAIYRLVHWLIAKAKIQSIKDIDEKTGYAAVQDLYGIVCRRDGE